MQAVSSDDISSCSPENGARNILFLPEYLGKLQARGIQAALLCLKSIFQWIHNHFYFKEPSQVYCIYLLAERLQSLRNC